MHVQHLGTCARAVAGMDGSICAWVAQRGAPLIWPNRSPGADGRLHAGVRCVWCCHNMLAA